MRAPADLRQRGRGRRFWTATLGRFELTGQELEVLHELCRTLDVLDDLAVVVGRDGPMALGSTGQIVAHPAVQEARLQRLVLARLAAALCLPDPDAQPERLGGFQTASERGRHAAQRRWHG